MDQDLLPVRKVAEATGIAPATLRVWERRYGRPRPRRSAAGQRRYAPEDVRHLRLVAEALKVGHRPRRLLGATEEELRALLDEARPAVADAEPDRWLDLALNATGPDLRARMSAVAAQRPLLELLDDVVAPFLGALGSAWADGRASIRHEHMAVEVLKDVLAEIRGLHAAPRRAAPHLALATPAGEVHDLGLAMLSTVLTERGFRHTLLGGDLPLGEIARAAREREVDVVALSLSLASAGAATQRAMKDLRALLPERVELWLGGRGATLRRRVPGLRTFTDLASFAEALGPLTPR